MTARLPLAATVFLAACGSDPAGQDAPLAGASVLLLTLDTTRADALGCYGGPDWTSPNLDRVARSGVLFAAARCAAPTTLPSHASLFTGRYPFEHGVRDNGTFVLPDEADTLAERLQVAGYRTGAVTAAFVLHSTFGLAQGFDHYGDVPRRSLEGLGGEEARGASEVVDEALRFLAVSDDERPFFLWVHFFDAHWPYRPDPRILPTLPEEADPGRARGRQTRRRRYLVEVATMDRQIGRLLAALPSDVLIAAVADHGEGLGDHREATHSFLVYDSTLRVPMLLHHPRLPQGRVIEERVSVVDLAPTLLSLLGIPPGPASGLDLAPLILEGTRLAERPVYFETCTTWYTYGWSPLYGLLEGSHKVILGPEPEVYHLPDDPGEERDLAAERPDLVQRARQRLQVLAARTAPPQRRALQEEDRLALEALGYLGGEGGFGDDALVPGRVPEGARDPREAMGLVRRYGQASELWRNGQTDQALESLRELVREEPDNPTFLGNAGAMFLQAGRAGEALPLLQRAFERSGGASAGSTLASCLADLRRPEEAIDVLRACVARSPSHLVSRLTLAELLVQQGRGSEAVPHLRSFLDQFEGDPATRRRAEALLDRARRAGG